MTEKFRGAHDGFELVGLRSDAVELTVAPALGGKIVSLIDRRTGRQWMWHPGDELKLFANRTGDAFENSTLAGADDCLPSVAACRVGDRQIPDHGEVWSAACKVCEGSEGKNDEIAVRCSLPISPLDFARSILLAKNIVELRYELRNRSAGPQFYLWAFHPLIKIHEEDELELPAGVEGDLTVEVTSREDVRGRKWSWTNAESSVDLSKLNLGETPAYVKAYWPRRASPVAITNRARSERISFEFDSPHIAAVGFWLTRGGWNGHHHLAIEPTNAPADSLETAIAENLCTPIPPGRSIAWSFRIIVGS